LGPYEYFYTMLSPFILESALTSVFGEPRREELPEDTKSCISFALHWPKHGFKVRVQGTVKGPYRITPETDDNHMLKWFYGVCGLFMIDPVGILKRLLIELTDPDRVRELDNFFALMATVFALIPPLVLALIPPLVPFLSASMGVSWLITTFYVLLWAVLYALYRVSVWKDAIDVRLFCVSYGIHIILVFVLFSLFSIVWGAITEGTIVGFMIVVVVMPILIVVVPGKCCSGFRGYWAISQKEWTKQWRILSVDGVEMLDYRSRAALKDIAGMMAPAGKYLALAALTLQYAVITYATGGEIIGVPPLPQNWIWIFGSMFAWLALVRYRLVYSKNHARYLLDCLRPYPDKVLRAIAYVGCVEAKKRAAKQGISVAESGFSEC